MKTSVLSLTVALLLLALLHGALSRPKGSASRRRNQRKHQKQRLLKLLRKGKTTPTTATTELWTPSPTPELWTPSPTPELWTPSPTPEQWTTTPWGCAGPDGQQVELGQEVRFSDCTVCLCMDWGIGCYVIDCMLPMCVDAVKPEGSCCYQCPNGPNCRIPDTGEIISTQVERDGMVCWCEFQPMWGYYSDDITAVCMPSITSPIPTPPMTSEPPSPIGDWICRSENGEVLFPGEQVMSKEPGSCKYCECTMEGIVCYYGDCLPPMCHDYASSSDQCCYTCPNGNNCIIQATGEVISEQVERDGQVCRCPEQSYYLPGVPSEEHYTAICTPLSTLSDIPDSTTTSDIVPETSPETTPEITPEISPETSPENSPETTSPPEPDTTPGTTPDTTPEPLP